MGDTLKDIPEFFETDLGECVTARTLSLATCRELGPPDLCHVIKANSKPGVKEIGSYHFVLGLDASSSATLAAYLNSLTYLLEIPQGWFAKSPVWRVRSGIYCCYNAFSRVDVRVEVKIPGGVDAYVVNSKAEKLPLKEEHWAETYVSAVLRSLHYSDDLTYRLEGLRYFNIIPDIDSEVRFFEAVESLFWKGHLLGAEADLQFANNVHNYLSDGIMKYLTNSGHYHSGINVFAKLSASDPEVNSLLAICYFDTDQELLGVQALCDGLNDQPSSFSLLLAQADFLISKGRLDMATTLARRAVNVAPSEFRTWTKLAEIYVELKDYRQALLTLNSCPMFALIERELPKMPAPQRAHFPTKPEAILAYGLVEEAETEESPSALSRLPGNTLKGTFAKAYKLLTLIASKVGWDELLRYRSSSFVMEEEYRMQKFRDDKPIASRRTPKNDQERADPSSAHIEASSQYAASIAKTPTIKVEEEDTNSVEVKASTEQGSEIQPESTSPESVKSAENKDTEENENFEKDEVSQPDDNASLEEKEPENPTSLSKDEETKETPSEDLKKDSPEGKEELIPAETSDDNDLDKSDAMSDIALSVKEVKIQDNIVSPIVSTGQSPSHSRSSTPASGTFQHKRLCERWLDNLFMVLYEDLRAFTSWRAEMSGTRSQRLTYRYSGSEWESLGDLCLRLHRHEEARDAYANCVYNKFSPRAWAYLLEQHTTENDLQKTMGALIRVAMYFEKIYSSCQIPSQVMRSIKHLIEFHGLTKIQNLLLSLDLSPEVLKVIDRYIALAISFKMKGTVEN